MSKIARRWVRISIAAAGLTGGCLLTLSALDSDPAAAADRQPLPAIVDRAERTVDRVLTRPDREYPPRVLPRHHRPPADCEEPADRPPPRKVRPRPTPPRPAPEPHRGEATPPARPAPDDQAPVEQPTPPAAEAPATPEPARPREPILDLPPVDVPPIVVDVPAVPVPPIVVDLPPLLPPTSPAAPEPVPAEPDPVEPAPVDAPPAPPATPRPVRPAPAAPVELDPADVASPRAGPSGRARADRSPEQADAVKPCERHLITRQGPRVQPKPTASTATHRPGRCPGHGPGTWADGTQPVTLKPPTGAPEVASLAAAVAIADGTLGRLLVARARAHLDGRPVAALDPRPA